MTRRNHCEGGYLAEGSVVVEGSLGVRGQGEGGGRVLGAGSSGGEGGREYSSLRQCHCTVLNKILHTVLYNTLYIVQ